MKAVEVRRKFFHFFMGLVLIVLIRYDIANVYSLAIFISVMAFMFYLSHKVTIPGLDWLIR
ncbi:hypothetical protein GOV09_00450, partial [Candidatus Woesearchaeota archaeon]|nr:hypothetical protein [Candidatus Woesearchaeota archaeon]